MTATPPRPRPDRPEKTRAVTSQGGTEKPRSGSVVRVTVRKIFGSVNGNYFLLLGTTMFLVIFGLVMVLSSSSVESYIATRDFFSGFLRQALFAILGIPAMLLAARIRPAFWRKWAGVFMIGAIVLQFLVVATGLGLESGGNRNWILLGSISFQPSELLKVGLALWLGMVLGKSGAPLEDPKYLARTVGIVSGLALALVVMGGDLGTTLILAMIILGTMFFSGVRLRFIVLPLVVLGLLAVIYALSGGSRQSRIEAWQSGCTVDGDYGGLCWQTLHGWWALASGGIFGVGLGNSKAKWSWLPEADNDFIFAIIGEEFGLLGAVMVLALFVLLAIAFVRIIRSTRDPVAKVTISAIMVWILGQAFVNIAVVLGLLPVLGVPLPLISAGGTALITTLIAIGIVLSYARNTGEPRAAGQ
ncbi:MAG: cell division protein FtsW [Cryobacterium sp.]|nr:cell division protein FtsW [Cryobacterium sp.]MBX3090665.1 cell division protein FtsW [Cryobacterium sp.]MBX3116042.1 cell division protein FtsW [Cryobacterium sp.]MCO5294055.1 putative lipid II flippase FtsW [Homoserinimonas sp.]MCW5944160.1 cell division protein FtsW [Cryobacterium sp.]